MTEMLLYHLQRQPLERRVDGPELDIGDVVDVLLVADLEVRGGQGGRQPCAAGGRLRTEERAAGSCCAACAVCTS